MFSISPNSNICNIFLIIYVVFIVFFLCVCVFYAQHSYLSFGKEKYAQFAPRMMSPA